MKGVNEPEARFAALLGMERLEDSDWAEVLQALIAIAESRPERALDLLFEFGGEPWGGFDAAVLGAIASTHGRDALVALLAAVELSSVRSHELLGNHAMFLAGLGSFTSQEIDELKRRMELPSFRDPWSGRVARRLARHGIDEAMEWVDRMEFPDSEARRLRLAAISGAAGRDAASVVGILEEVAGGSVGERSAEASAFGLLILSWLAQEPAAAMDYIQSMPPHHLVNIIKTVNGMDQAIMAVDPGVLAERLAMAPATQANLELFDRVARRLAGSDFEGALAFVDSLPDGPAKDQSLGGLFRGHYSLVTDLSSLDFDGLSGSVLTAARRASVAEMAVRDPAEALSFARSSEGQRQDLVVAIAETVAARHPSQIDLILDGDFADAVSPDFRAAIIETSVRGRAHVDLDEGVEWVLSRQGEDRISAVSGLMDHWMSADPVAASEWLAEQPSGPARDAGTRVLIEQIRNTDPERARQWEATLGAGD